MKTRTLEIGGMACLAVSLTLSIGASASAVMQDRVQPDFEGLSSLHAAIRLRGTGQLREFDARIAGLRAYADNGNVRLERALAAVESVRRVEEQIGLTAAMDGVVAGGLLEAEDALSNPPSPWATANTVWLGLMASAFAAIAGAQLGVAARRRLAERRLIVQALGLVDVDDDAIADEVALHSIRLKARPSSRSDAGELETVSCQPRVVQVPSTEVSKADPIFNDSFRPTRRRG